MGTRKTREEMDAQMEELASAAPDQEGMAQAGLTEEEILAELAPRQTPAASPDDKPLPELLAEPADSPDEQLAEELSEDPGVGPILAQLVEPAAGALPEGAEAASLQPAELLPAEAEPALTDEEIQAIETSTEVGRIRLLVESLLFAAGEPMPIQNMLPILREIQPLLTFREVKHLIEQLRTDLREQGGGCGSWRWPRDTSSGPLRRPPRTCRSSWPAGRPSSPAPPWRPWPSWPTASRSPAARSRTSAGWTRAPRSSSCWRRR